MLDVSVAAAWFLPSQWTARSQALLQRAGQIEWSAPQCFAYEWPNLLLREEGKRKLPPGGAFNILSQTSTILGPLAGPAPAEEDFRRAFRLAWTHAIALFDAFYLMDAVARNGVLASRDGALLSAAAKLDCEVYDARDP